MAKNKNKKTLVEKIGEIQQEIDPLKKDKKVSYGNGVKYRYADINQLLDNLLPLLKEKGIIVMQPIRTKVVGDQMYDVLETILTDGEDEIKSEKRLNKRKDPQDFGSDNTYMRRYLLITLLGLRAEDDDGQRVSKQKKQQKKKEKYRKKLSKIDDIEKLNEVHEKNKGIGKWFDELIQERKDEIKNS